MSIVTLTWLRNEGDIVETFVRYHCQFVDRMILIDNGSADDTFAILTHLQEEGLPIECSQQPSLTHTQAAVLTHAMRTVAEREKPDWILPLDADEFLVATDGGNPLSILRHLSQEQMRMLRWRSYIPHATSDTTEPNILKRIRHRRTVEDPQWYKVLIPSLALEQCGAEAALCCGNHRVESASCAHTFEPALSLAHFPVRSTTQLAIKIIGHWLRYASSPQRTPGTIFQWEELYQRLMRHSPLTDTDLTEIASTYATRSQWNALFGNQQTDRGLDAFLPPSLPQPTPSASLTLIEDPVMPAPDIRYTHQPLDPWTFLCQSAEEIALALGERLRATS